MADEDIEPDDAPKEEIVGLTVTEMELEALRRDAGEYKDKYLRVLAESENLKKRLQKEKQEIVQYAVQGLVVDMLNPLDHLEGALNHAEKMSDEVKHWAFGFQMILAQFKEVLANHGVKPFKSEGEPFDPHLHEAVEMVPSDFYEPGTVVEESLKGYKMGERTIRPARVKVSKEKEKKDE